jgi:RNA polymerase sigma-70 factor (ECF subfamily)
VTPPSAEVRSRYARLLGRARRLVRSDPEDLLQEALLIALEAGRSPLADEADAAWCTGVLSLRARARARAAGRRRMRETAWAELRPAATLPATPPVALGPLAGLPPAARQLALLALHGLGGEEIRWLLGLSPAAFRQRVAVLRRALRHWSPEQRAAGLRAPGERPRPSAVGLLRRTLARSLRLPLAAARAVGTHDPDGHPLLLRARDAHVSAIGGNSGAGRRGPLRQGDLR